MSANPEVLEGRGRQTRRLSSCSDTLSWVAEAETVFLVPPRSVPRLGEGEVHVWKAEIGTGHAAISGEEILSGEEKERAGRFRFEADRIRYVTGRIALRRLLSAYTGLSPRELVLEADGAGKLRLAGASTIRAIHFNHSHSGEVVLLAFAQGARVGVDVERLRRDIAYEDILGPLLSPQERDWIRSSVPDSIPAALVRQWVRREAYLKATGRGLRGALGPFPWLATAEGSKSSGAAGEWQLVDLVLAPPYLGVLAVEGRNWRTRCWQWSPDLAHGSTPG